MKTPIENGVVGQDNPARTLTKRATYFIAYAARYASVNTEFNISFLVLVFVAILKGVL